MVRFNNVVLIVFVFVSVLLAGKVPPTFASPSTVVSTPNLSNKLLLPVINQASAWSGRILYTRSTTEQGADALWSIDANGRNDQQVLVCPGGCAMYNLTASSNGAQIAYLAVYPNNSPQVRLVAPDGTGDRLLFAPAPNYVGGFTFSPDGSQLAVTITRYGEFSLWIADTAGGTPRQLAPWQPWLPVAPVWQNNEHLLYTNEAGSIARVAADGGTQPQQVLAEGTVLELAPDRTTVVVAQKPIYFSEVAPPTQSYAIGRIEGTQFRTLYRSPDDEPLATFAWSPTSTRLAQANADELAVVQPDGTRAIIKRIAADQWVADVDWTVDERNLLYALQTNDGSQTIVQVQRISVADGSEQTLATISGNGGEFVVVP